MIRTLCIPLRSLALGTVVFLTGCTFGPNYQQPALDMPENYRFASAEQAESFANLPWWEVFKDPLLQDLIHTALANNRDLRQAVARVEQARNLAVVAKAPLFPQVNYGGELGTGKNAVFNAPAVTNGDTEGSALLALNVAWEIDIWGRIRRLSEAARAEFYASEEARRGIAITIVSDVATAYYQLLDLDRELEIQRAAVRAYERTLKIFTDRKDNGIASKLETDRAEVFLANAAAIIPDLETRVAQTENLLNVLLGRNPAPIVRASNSDALPEPPAIPVGLPSELLERRPDVAASEQLLVAANADIGASLANFYPRIGLTTFFGKASPELSAFTAGSTNMWDIGASLAGPIFQGGQIRAEHRAAIARFDEAVAAYQQSVLTAFREVSDFLITKEKLIEVQAFNNRAVTAAESSVKLSFDRYINGKSSYIEVLLAQQDLYPTQRAQVQSQVGELIAVIQLYKALGGGWSPPADSEGRDADGETVPAARWGG